jgi:putative ABC transport system substrate-binding protein
MNERRKFMAGLSAIALSHPLRALAQQAPRPVQRIGVLLFNSPQIDPISPLLEGLHDLGYASGKSVTVDYRYAEGKADRLPAAAAELVQLKPDVIVAVGGDVAPHVKSATASIPIVVLVSNDPVRSGLVTSLARPGANVTGMTLIYDELAGKVLELLKQAVPSISRVGVLWNPDHADPEFQETQRAAALHGVTIQSLEVRRPADFDVAFEAAAREETQAIIVVSSRVMFQHRRQIVDFGLKHGIPMAGSWGNWARDGLLLTFGPSQGAAMRLLASYVDKVLKGAPPATLPMERPARFEFVLNMKTAKALKLDISPALLARADEVIE